MSTATVRSPQTCLPAEAGEDVAEVRSFLDAHQALRGGSIPPRYLVIGDGEGEQIELPAPLYRALVQVAEALAGGQAVTIAPRTTTLTTQEVADLLGVSRPTVVRLVERGDLPAERVGSRRRIVLADALDYRDRRRAAQYAMLAETVVDLDEEEAPDVVRERLSTARRLSAERRRGRLTGSRHVRGGPRHVRAVAEPPDGIAVLTAAEFARDTVSVSPSRALGTVIGVAARYRDPPRQLEEILGVLESRYAWHAAVGLMREAV